VQRFGYLVQRFGYLVQRFGYLVRKFGYLVSEFGVRAGLKHKVKGARCQANGLRIRV